MLHKILFPILLCVATPVVAAETASATAVVDGYRLNEGDVIGLEVHGEPGFGGAVALGASGQGNFPYVGMVDVGGLTVEEATVVLTERLAAEYLVDPKVSLWVKRYGSQPVRVLGAVEEPGVYFLRKPTYLTEILAEAGGVLEADHVSEVQIRSADGEQRAISLRSLLELGESDVLLSRGDVVYLPPGEVVYLSGQVTKPGAVPMEKGLTALQALTRAGGPTATARLKGAYILRDGEQISLNLRRIMRGRDADMELLSGDQLIIRESMF